MCSFCFQGFEIVTVIERDADRRQAEPIQMLGEASDSGKHVMDAAEEMFSPSINTRTLLNHLVEHVWPAKQLKFPLSLPLGDNELSQLQSRTSEGEQESDVKKTRHAGETMIPKDPAGRGYMGQQCCCGHLIFYSQQM